MFFAENNGWNDVFSKIEKKDYFNRLIEFLSEEYKSKTIYPPKELLFNAFKLTPLNSVKVVILGQDPYPNPGQAMGLAFSVKEGIALPPSLKNIFKEIMNEFNISGEMPKSGDLTYLAKQGVLLLNPYLTVVAHKPLSHKIKEYDLFFNDIMNELNNTNRPIVFLLWGNNAKKYHKLLNNSLHLVIETAHPSPLSANQGGWFNSGCFLKTNEFLKANNEKDIIWMK